MLSIPMTETFSVGTLSPMPRKKLEGKRYFVRLSDEDKRMLDFLSVDAGVESTEAFGGELLSRMLREMWDKFDPKRRADSKRPKR